MIYWLFKKYMKRLVNDYEAQYKKTFDQTRSESMRPDFYWLQKFLRGDL